MQIDTSWIKEKGRKGYDPLLFKHLLQKKHNLQFQKAYSGDASNVFIGQQGYPNLNVGLLSTPKDIHHDDPKHWVNSHYSIPQIVDLRMQLVNAHLRFNVKALQGKFLELTQEVALAQKPAQVEVTLEKKPQFSLQFPSDTAPHGPQVKVQEVALTQNPHVPKAVDQITSDTDLKATEGLSLLAKKGFDEHYLTRILSTGQLGVGPQRKLVPTRWSITSVDDTLGKQLMTTVKHYDTTPNRAYFGGILGNYYLILFFDRVFSYELFEMIVGESGSFATDYEPYDGRTTYADATAGGYYACRLAILENLSELKKQASVLALRFIRPDEYVAPLGVWVCRNATRNALLQKPLEFGSSELLLTYALHFARKRFGFDLTPLFAQSKLLRALRTQKRLSDYR